MTKNILIGLVLAGVLVFLLLVVFDRSRPVQPIPDNSREIALIDSLATVRKQVLTLAEKLGVDTLRRDSVLNRLQIENKGYRSRLAKIRPVIQQIADTSAIVSEFLSVSDSLQDNSEAVIATQAAEIVELRQISSQLVRNSEVQERIHTELMAHRDTTIAILQDDNRKLRRKLVVTKIISGVVVLAVVAASL